METHHRPAYAPKAREWGRHRDHILIPDIPSRGSPRPIQIVEKHRFLIIVREIDGCLADPRPGQPLPNHSSEEIFGVCEMVTSPTDEVIVHQEDVFFPNQPQFANGIGNGSVAKSASIEGRDATKAAI